MLEHASIRALRYSASRISDAVIEQAALRGARCLKWTPADRQKVASLRW